MYWRPRVPIGAGVFMSRTPRAPRYTAQAADAASRNQTSSGLLWVFQTVCNKWMGTARTKNAIETCKSSCSNSARCHKVKPTMDGLAVHGDRLSRAGDIRAVIGG